MMRETEYGAAPRFLEACPPLPAAVGLSRLQVYDWPGGPGSDGVCGGTPHMHLACAEAYAVISGVGALETLTADGHVSTPLAEGDLVWFTPGTVHRLVNGGDLRLIVLMQNAGLPEAGDAVLTLPEQVLADPQAYKPASALDPDDPERSARERRDLAVAGFNELRQRMEAGDRGALTRFHDAALRLVADDLPRWRERVRGGPGLEVDRTLGQLDALESGDTSHLSSAVLRRGAPGPALGMCGHLVKFGAAEDTRSDAPQPQDPTPAPPVQP